ncbi:hypothetical protein CONPUDRAFT_65797 [Coniophora puteana RWD-64-598 SS2]|uniref:Hemerythrin-like domain-containing protein n=1 Tax=Coniophora puteana (strain RWD-64-598) TaxID=741705 RepID=A0A5M3MA60_CONPW|nr:uncharacterized protein CONPUDRAFT_65797 [Coniophora puteana RWD-64-598 SS2]EIW75525.1 hypothetical protein CONPUDRAFT_65797 [Coniophora puteana RWD-64-598 SS2]
MSTETKALPPLTDAIVDDHREMFEYYKAYEAAKKAGDAARQGRIIRLLTWEVVRHAFAEETVVYPLMEQRIPDGKKLADEDRRQHLAVKKLLAQLEKETPGTEAYDSAVQKAWQHLQPHNDSEEKNDLPQLEAALANEEESRSHAKSFGRIKVIAPTRGHPGAPDRPPLETIAGMLTAPLDKIQDLFAQFPKEEDLRT